MSPAESATPAGESPTDPLLSVIIVSWKVVELLQPCLQSLYDEAGLPHDALEVFVVDNDSRDGSVEMVRTCFPAAHVIANHHNAGFGAANNQALPLCRGEFILLLNPDTVVLPGAVAKMLEHLRAHPRTAALGPRLLNGDGSLQRWTGGAFPTLWNVACHHLFLGRLLPRVLVPSPLFLDRDWQQPLAVEWVSGACMLLRREALDGKLFDPRIFMYGEDMELCHRLHNAGWTVVYFPPASIVHYQGRSMRRAGTGEILSNSLKGPRIFYGMIECRATHRLAFDLMVVAGFALRVALYGAVAVLRPRGDARERMRACMRYLRIALQLLRAPR